MFKQTAREKGLDLSEVRGTGLRREFVPDFMQENVQNEMHVQIPGKRLVIEMTMSHFLIKIIYLIKSKW